MVFIFSPNFRDKSKYDRNPEANYDEYPIDDATNCMVKNNILCQLKCYDFEEKESPNKYGKLNKFLYFYLAVGRFVSLAFSNNFGIKHKTSSKYKTIKTTAIG